MVARIRAGQNERGAGRQRIACRPVDRGRNARELPPMRTRRNALGRQILELGGPIRCSAQTLSLNTSSHLSWWRHAAVGNGIAHRLLSDDAIAIKWWLRSARRVSVSALRRDRRARESLAAAAPETVPTQKRCMHTLILRNVTQQFIGEHWSARCRAARRAPTATSPRVTGLS